MDGQPPCERTGLHAARVFLCGGGWGCTKLLQLLHAGQLPGSKTFWAHTKGHSVGFLHENVCHRAGAVCGGGGSGGTKSFLKQWCAEDELTPTGAQGFVLRLR